MQDMTIDAALAHWQEQKLLTKKKAMELRAALPDHLKHGASKAISIFATIGAVLVGLGVILFVGSNWEALTPAVKIGLLVLGILATAIPGYYFAYEKTAYFKTGMALLFVSSLIYGASIFLVAQIYHLPMNFWFGGLLWLLGVLWFAYAFQSRPHMFLAVPLLVVTVGWMYASARTGGNELDFLFDTNRSLAPLLPVMGGGLLALSILHRKVRGMAFGASTLLLWGIVLFSLMLLISTADRQVFFMIFRFPSNTSAWIIAALCIALAIGALAVGSFVGRYGKAAFLAVLLYIAFVYVLAYVPVFFNFPETTFYYGEAVPGMLTGLYVLHVILAAIFFMILVWEGMELKMPAFVNLGILGITLVIIIQYFSWAFTQLNRSLAFLLGGILILLLSAAMEHQRRRVLSTIPS